MPHRMDVPDIGRASLALLDWLDSQEIRPTDAVPVLAVTIASLLAGLSLQDGRPVKIREKMVASMIAESIRAMTKEGEQ